MATIKILGNYKDNDIELCRTTNHTAGDETVQALLEASIPFTKNCKKIPFFQRTKYNGAQKVWVITTNPDRYGQARRVIDTIDVMYRKRLMVSNF
ncbi:MAG: hypothetical protein IKJ01_08500 [Lachnospiraceae bacterium]|nr:hypothetical protein [Lachnospiraceae bacterium]